MKLSFSRTRGLRLAAACAVAGGLLAAYWWLRPAPVARSVGPAGAKAQAPLQGDRADLCTAANAKGVGLRGEYFAGERFSGTPVDVRVDETVDFTAPLTAGAAQPVRSVRWRGWVRPPLNGRYRFHVEPATATVTVGRELLSGPGAPADAAVELTIGKYYPVIVEVPVLGPEVQRVRLQWTAPHGVRFTVPKALLFLPSETAAPSASR